MAGVVAAVIVLGLAAGVGRAIRSSGTASYGNAAANVVTNAMYDPATTYVPNGAGDADAPSTKRQRMSDVATSGGGRNTETMGYRPMAAVTSASQYKMQSLDHLQLDTSHDAYPGHFSQKDQDRHLQAHSSGPGSVSIPAMQANSAHAVNAGFTHPSAVAMALPHGPKREVFAPGVAETNLDHLALGTSLPSRPRGPLPGPHGQPFAVEGPGMQQLHALQQGQQPTLLFSNGQPSPGYQPSMSQMHGPAVYDPSVFRPGGAGQGVPLGMHGMVMSGSPVPRAGQPASSMHGPSVHDSSLVPASSYGNVQNTAVMAYGANSNGMYYVPNGAHAHQPPITMGGQPSVQAPWMMNPQMTPQMAAQMAAQMPAIYYNGHPMHPGGMTAQMPGTMQLAPHGLAPAAAAAAAATHGGDGKRNPAPLPKLGRLHQVPLKEWTVGITKACRTVFSRLEIMGAPKVRDDILRRLLAGVDVDTCRHTDASPTKCFLVRRGNPPGRGPRKKSPFQIPVAGSRILAQKALYAAYNKLSAQQMGTWQVNQKCKRNDSDWWCFEPSHLEKCERDHLAKCVEKHPIPRDADAIYVSRVRAQAHGPKKEARFAQDSSQPQPLSQPQPQPQPVPGGDYLAAGPGGPMGANGSATGTAVANASSTATTVTTMVETVRGIDARLYGVHNNGYNGLANGLANGQPQLRGLYPRHVYAMPTGAPYDPSGSAATVPAAPDDSSGPPLGGGSPYDESSSSPSVESVGSSVDSNYSELNQFDVIDGALTGGVSDFMQMPQIDIDGFAYAADSTLLQN